MECSSLVFQEEENAHEKGAEKTHGKGAENEMLEDVGFPEKAEKINEIIEDCPDPLSK